MPPGDLLNTEEAARFLGVSDDTIRRWVAKRTLRHVRLPSGQLRFYVADLEAALQPVEPDGAA